MDFCFPLTCHFHVEHSAGCCREEAKAACREDELYRLQNSLRNGGVLFLQNARLFMFANVNICKSRRWAPADWEPPEGLEEALFTCSEECCPAPTLLYLTGTQGHSAGRDGPLCPSLKFPPHNINSTTQCGRRKWNSCSCCNSVQKPRFRGPFYLWWVWVIHQHLSFLCAWAFLLFFKKIWVYSLTFSELLLFFCLTVWFCSQLYKHFD